METLYQPGLASESCYVVPAASIAVALFLSAGVMLILPRFVARGSPKFRTIGGTLLAAPAIFLVVVSYSVLSGRESIVRIATDGSELEYRYCSRLSLHVERHPLTALTSAEYRRDVQRRRGPDRVYHRLDLNFAGRSRPITITLDDASSELDLDLAEQIAPAAVRQYRTTGGQQDS